jgi:hypothetical protein
MSDEIIDVTSEHLGNIPQEEKTSEGLNIPDPSVVETTTEENEEILRRRNEVRNIPEYPKEWREGYADDEQTDENDLKVPVTATIKQDEINKLIKKYKRYMKSNLREIRRVENDA